MAFNMLDFVPKKAYLWGISLYYCIQKKPAAEAQNSCRDLQQPCCQKQHAEIGLDA